MVVGTILHVYVKRCDANKFSITTGIHMHPYICMYTYLRE